ncbi:SUMF1/EgtB/PvdO family nonheme iron enzyme [Aetokthonos hydrillicola Thurmond2011]|uniref:SUMF1/EgtB/PvdO family nonheme iron enzyme n=1 Tax=Aetokthonos hydrillicola Thurmond2011 TaxID=2712845 RepID=A0AAP5MC56_9CYAN|nr:SUMF1/EgtB/PvdO family nonheme iron enzyme [Aetokthonos hydrillicola]MBO3459901.1 SUMF1/EgtB/PvdO family nonheme iron enzyme [Aetokthonos hydrillicola CCALA 1050]MBW4584018.1 SUMF1/EgtB/PvdO family nonheme iron enzyme [Aetokthonos hydrillicola CCALA 1050]MDR9898787.1 SUMF1/EgtB/PvdO family nonheme iron enzyme [Aetokthonos hydrillicola Thurmond2011]
MLRGGSWNNNPQNCRCAYRNRNNPDNDNNNIGFRVVFDVSPSALLCQNLCMGIHGVRQRRVQTCSCGVGDITRKSNLFR